VSDYRVTVRVHLDDGSTTEISRKLHYSSAGLHSEGDILPVRYDPADHSKIEIDVPALKARRKARLAKDTAWKESLIAQAESQVARSAASGAAASSGPAMDRAGGEAELAELLHLCSPSRESLPFAARMVSIARVPAVQPLPHTFPEARAGPNHASCSRADRQH
jgi:hypothetical protein